MSKEQDKNKPEQKDAKKEKKEENLNELLAKEELVRI